MSGYEVEHVEHGVLIRATDVPMREYVALLKMFEGQGMDALHPGIAKALGAHTAIVKKGHAEAWEAEVAKAKKKEAKGDAEWAWLIGSDTGTSSETIFSVLSKKHADAALARLGSWGPCTPADPDDFGRCYRLLKAIPGWRARLPEVAKAHPSWRRMVKHWAEMERLYEEEFETGRAPKLYAFMQKLRGTSE